MATQTSIYHISCYFRIIRVLVLARLTSQLALSARVVKTDRQHARARTPHYLENDVSGFRWQFRMKKISAIAKNVRSTIVTTQDYL